MSNIIHLSANMYKPEINFSDHTAKIWRELSKDYDEYHIMGRSIDNHFHHIDRDNIHLHLVPKIARSSSTFLFSSLILLHYVRKYKINVILAQSSVVGGFSAVMAKKVYGCKLLTEIHGEEYFTRYQNNWILRHIRDFSFKNSDRIRALSPKMVEKLNRIGFTDNIFIVPNRVNLALFNKPKTSQEISGKVKIISIGRFWEAKNYSFLLKNLNRLEFPFHLKLIGGGRLRPEYEEIIKEEGLENKVTLVDGVPQAKLVEELSMSDIYVQSSIHEGVPRTIIEAMGMRLPIISTNVGSIEGIIVDGYNGLLCAPNSVELFEQIKKLVLDQSLREYLANNAYEDARTKYDWDIAFEKYHQFIRI